MEREQVDELLSSLGEIKGEVNAFTSYTHDEIDELKAAIGQLDAKLDELLIREATRLGEVKGHRRFVTAMAAIISFVINGIGIYVGMRV